MTSRVTSGRERTGVLGILSLHLQMELKLVVEVAFQLTTTEQGENAVTRLDEPAHDASLRNLHHVSDCARNQLPTARFTGQFAPAQPGQPVVLGAAVVFRNAPC